MPGRIRHSDVEEVKARTNIADLIGEHVTLRSAGVGSLKGLCPFHDERSPSFNVRPALGVFHCFGCGESGDAISFLQKIEHVTFAEAVERLAARLGYTLHYEDGEPSRDAGARSRLLAANLAAAEFFAAQLGTPEAAPARQFLGGRGFDAAAAATFGVGYAPQGWSRLRQALSARGFSEEEQLAAGLLSKGERGAYDRFRGRLVWPIKDTSGQVLGFGARRLGDDDTGPKYLNTPETAVYHKNQVLYGIDLARREISRQRRVVVVEGYTDVMACHLAGVTTAVATCGTAFGPEHLRMIRRILGDGSGVGELVFTFDSDQAGQTAALRAFEVLRAAEGQGAAREGAAAQAFVAAAPDGLDPCDLRLQRGEAAVREIVERRRPLFDFVIRQRLAPFDLETVEGRAGALRATVPVVAEIHDPALRPGYTRELARMLGLELAEVQAAVRRVGASAGASAAGRGTGGDPGARGRPRADVEPGARGDGGSPAGPSGSAAEGQQERPSLRRLPTDPVTRTERDALMALLQHPELVPPELYRQAVGCRIGDRTLAVVRDALVAEEPAGGGPQWIARLEAALPEPYLGLLHELVVAPLPARDGPELGVYVRGIVTSLVSRELLARRAELTGRLQRLAEGDPEGARQVQRELMQLELERRRLTEAG